MVIVWPADLAPSEMEFWHEANTLVSRSPLSGAQSVQVRGPGRWRARLTFTDRGPAASARLDALLAQLDGAAGEVALFDFRRPRPNGTGAFYTGGPVPLAWPAGLSWPPGISWPSYQPPVSPRLTAPATRGDAAIATAGWAANETVLRAGDYLALGGTLHIVVADVTTNAGGEATIALRPRLRFAQAAGTRLVIEQPVGVFRLAAQGVANPTRPGRFSTYVLEFEESLPGSATPPFPLPPDVAPVPDVPWPLSGFGVNVERNMIVADYVGDGIIPVSTVEAISRHAAWVRNFPFNLEEMALRSGTTLLTPANLEASANFNRWMSGLQRFVDRGRPVMIALIPGQGTPDQDPDVFTQTNIVAFLRHLGAYLAQRFTPAQAVLQPWNEIRSSNAAFVNSLAAAAYAALREVAPQHWICISGPQFGRIWNLADVTLPPEPYRLAFAVHDYEIVPDGSGANNTFPFANRINFLAEQRARFAAAGYTPPIVLGEYDPAERVEAAGPVAYPVNSVIRGQRIVEIRTAFPYDGHAAWAATQGDINKARQLLAPANSPVQDWHINIENALAPGTHTIAINPLIGGQVTFPHTLTVSGTYTGRPSAIEVRQGAGAWSTLVASPTGGTFTGTVSVPAQGPAITISVRFANGDGVIATATVTLTSGAPATGEVTSVTWSAGSTSAAIAGGGGGDQLNLQSALHDHSGAVDAQITTANGAVSAWASRAGVAGAMSQATAANQPGHSSTTDLVTFAAASATDVNGDWLRLNTTLENRYANDPDALGVVYMLGQITSAVTWTTWLFRLGVNNVLFAGRDRRAYHLGLFTATDRVIGIRGNDTTNNNATVTGLPAVNEWFALAFVLNDSRAAGVRNGASDQISRVFIKSKTGGTFATMNSAASAATTQTASSWSNVEGTVGILRHNASATATGVGNWRMRRFAFDAEPPITNAGIEAILDQLLGEVP